MRHILPIRVASAIIGSEADANRIAGHSLTFEQMPGMPTGARLWAGPPHLNLD